MGRKRIYNNAAERQKARRERVAAGVPVISPKAEKKVSRPARLTAIGSAIKSLLTEYRGWLDRLPQSLVDGEQSSLLSDTIEKLETMADVLEDITPPRGFGRD